MMRNGDFTAEWFRSWLSYDPETGLFARLCRNDPRPVGAISPKGYLTIIVKNHRYFAHRLAFLWMTGKWPEGTLDHINRIRGDNRWGNLRPSTVNESAMNRVCARKRHDLPRGVNPRRGKFYARIRVGDERFHLGTFNTAQEAHAAYEAAAARLHGQFACMTTKFVGEQSA